ncbi:MAG TPA: A/G-specific adenine glycosylase [Acidimicrobiales bacterium]|nr:A/G-specific adenine glycosylase [Acidimicrobiales bacterium]
MPAPALSPFQAAVLGWWESHRRDLPWRTTRAPWAVLVSELMLQQTQVARVVPRWHAFLARFPSTAACAAAPAGDVLQAWEGLGYNRRALNLHRAAQVAVERHGGALPPDLDALVALPGVGPYTARAVLAYAFEADVGLVETNTARVLARAVAGRRLTAAEAQAAADRVVPAGSGWAWNQALVDLGATTCTKRAPACDRCPVSGACAWAAAGWAGPDPAAGTAGTGGRRSAFAGSDRQGRGRLVAVLRRGPLALGDLAVTCGWPSEPDRARRVAATLVADGLAREADGVLHLP